MQINTFQYPINWQKAYIHRKSNFLGKSMIVKNGEIQDYGQCQYCNRKIGYLPDFQCCMDIKQKFSTYGPNVVLYYQIAKRIIYFLIYSTVLFGIPAIVLNLTGDGCQQKYKLCAEDNIIFNWTILNIFNDKDKILVQLIIWLIICISVIPFNIYLRYYTKKLFNQIDQQNETQADYSIIIRSLPKDTTQQDIQQLIETIREDLTQSERSICDNLQIVECFPIYKMKKYVTANQENHQNFKKYIRLGKQDIFVPDELPQFRQFSGAALVTFTSAYANNFINYDVKAKEQIISYFFPFYKPLGKYSVKDKFVSIQKAPQPTDIIWKHFGYSQCNRIWRKIKYTILTYLLLIISAGVSYGLAQARIYLLNKGYNIIGFQIAQVIISFLFNSIIYSILYTSTRKQKLDTFTDQKVELMQKVSFYQAINLGFFTLIVPFLAKLPDIKGGLKELSIAYNVILVIIIQVLAQSVATFFIKYTEILLSVYKFLVQFKLIIATQTEANLAFQGSQLDFVNHFVYILRTVWFSLVFSVVSPICLFIGTLGLILSYFIEKYLISQKYSIPQYGDYRLNSQFIDLLDATPILIGLFNLLTHLARKQFKYQQIQIQHRIIIFLCIGVGLFNFMMPWAEIVKKRVQGYDKDIQTKYQQAKDQFQVTYEQINPLTRIGIKLKRIQNRMRRGISQKYYKQNLPKTNRQLLQDQKQQ